MTIKTIPASPKCYGELRDHNAVKFIVIHYTGIDNDTAVNEGNAFKNNKIRSAGAHFFVDRKGNIVKSVNLNRIAWSVGGKKYPGCDKNGGGKFYGICTNANSVSIEMCDCLHKDPSEAQIKAIVETIKYIRKYCKNANYIIRHFDVNGKLCPGRMTDAKSADSVKWIKLKARLHKDAGMDVK